MGINVSILSSGSQGNAAYIESDHTRLLIDAGLSGKKIESLLEEIGRSADMLDGILVTHEHGDHIRGVGVLARRYHLPVYANADTWKAMESSVGDIALEQKQQFDMGTTMSIGDIEVESYGVSHDATCPQFYQCYNSGKRFVTLTDTGYCSERLEGQLKGADAYLIETNHDVRMLRASRYPWNLQQRILGDQGHLSNEDSADVMTRLVGQKTTHIYLGHRSQEANLKLLAHDVMKDTLEKADIDVQTRITLEDVDPEQPTVLQAL